MIWQIVTEDVDVRTDADHLHRDAAAEALQRQLCLPVTVAVDAVVLVLPGVRRGLHGHLTDAADRSVVTEMETEIVDAAENVTEKVAADAPDSICTASFFQTVSAGRSLREDFFNVLSISGRHIYDIINKKGTQLKWAVSSLH